MKKIIKIAPLLLILTLLLTGCTENNKGREVDRDSVLEATYNEDMEEIHEIVRNKDLGDFTLVTKYDTIDYDLNKWRIVDNKTIKVSVWTEGLPDDWDVIVEHAHIDMFITNKYEKYPVILQDSMDDKYHGIKQDGFVIGDNVVYENIFGIEGANDFVNETVNNSGFAYLRESDFSYYHYTTNTMQVVYDVMVKKPGNDFYETIAVYDEIVIPVGYKTKE